MIDGTRVESLETAAELEAVDRAKQCMSRQQRMECFAAYLELYRSFSGQRMGEQPSPAHEAAMVMVLAKVARITVGARGHKDNYTDAAKYLAIAYEADA